MIDIRTEVFPEVIIGFRVDHTTFVRGPVLRNSMAYVEGGCQQQMSNFINFMELLQHVISIRLKYGTFKHYLLNPKPLNFTSKITLTFLIYAICILLSIIAHGGEIVHSKRVIIAVFFISAIAKFKLILFEQCNRKMEQLSKCFLSWINKRVLTQEQNEIAIDLFTEIKKISLIKLRSRVATVVPSK